MKIFALLSGENYDLAADELKYLLQAKRLKRHDNIVVCEITKTALSFLHRLAYTKQAYQLIFTSTNTSTLKNIKSVNWNRYVEGTFRVTTSNMGDIAKQYAKHIYLSLKNPKVSITKPNTIIGFIKAKKKVFCGKSLFANKEKFAARKAKLLPHSHPTTLDPKLARAMINVTGVRYGKFLDPFCGAGGILYEAALLGFETHGFEIDHIMIKRAILNLEFLQIKGVKLHLKNALNLRRKFDLIVTDFPYGRNSRLEQDDLLDLYSSFLLKAYKYCDEIVVGLPDFIDYKGVIGFWKVKAIYKIYLHKSLSKIILKLKKK